MESPYEHDIFVSYAKEDHGAVEATVVEPLRKADLKVSWDKDIPVGAEWDAKLDAAIKASRYMLVYCTVNSKASEWVSREIETFDRLTKTDPSRRFVVLRGPDCNEKHVPALLMKVQHAASIDQIIIQLLREQRRELKQNLGDVPESAERLT